MENFTWQQVEALVICNAWYNYEELSDEDVDFIAYCDLKGLSPYFQKMIANVFNAFMKDHNAEDWDDYDENYPNNPFHEGYKYNGNIYITNYTGDAGRYWNGSLYERICK